MTNPVFDQTARAPLRSEMTVAETTECVLTCLFSRHTLGVIIAHEHGVKITLQDVGGTQSILLIVLKDKALSAGADVLAQQLCDAGMQFDEPLAVVRLEKVFLPPGIVLLDYAKAVATIQNVLDFQPDGFADAQTRCRQHDEQHLVYTLDAFDDLAHLSGCERRTTKVNWNNAEGIGRHPITITFARRVGVTMTELGEDDEPNPLYRFYM